MERLEIVGIALVLLVALAVGAHMVTLFVISTGAIAWHLIVAFVAHPIAGAFILLAAVTTGILLGIGIEFLADRASRTAGRTRRRRITDRAFQGTVQGRVR